MRGRQVRNDIKTAQTESKEEIKISEPGINLHPNLQISRDRETRGFLILGSIGGGKTQIINYVVNQILSRGDKALIFDNKGDFTSGLLDQPGVRLIAPWDSRSLAWDVAKDCTTKADAAELAARLIPESSDPTWSNGARQILAAMIVHAQSNTPGEWSFADIAATASKEYEQLREICLAADPKLALLLPEKPTKTTQSFLSQLIVFMGQVFSLADAWSDCGHGGPVQKFSLRNWLLNPQAQEQQTKILLMQSHGRYQKLAQAYIQSLISALASIVNSPDLPDSRKRRLWLVLDEFPQLGKVESIEKFVEIGRSKGVRTLLATQDINQVRSIYSHEFANALSSMVGTVIACRTQGAETPQWLSSLIGERQVKRYSPTFSAPVSGLGGYAAVPQRTDNWLTTTEPVVAPNEFAMLGPNKNGVQALLLTGGEFVFKLIWPFSKLPGDNAPTDPAPWTQPGWPNAADKAAENIAQLDIDVDTNNPKPKTAAQPQNEPQHKKTEPREHAEEFFDMLPVEAEANEEKKEESLFDKSAEEALGEIAENIAPEPIGTVLQVVDLVDKIQDAKTTAEPTTPAPIHIKKRLKRKKREHEHEQQNEQ
ncbi:type IV secretion system DNA-binding domain-containing protein [Methylocaldum szegediense]|uniref:Type IV secretion system protein VirD4 n=1 Tax=Methylocaldum szegediense TaxID=73780 RepID=A0ABM9I1N2_9GAMM|nr:type IV secretion system DNA-binding domain-containing protein [Methylocaldum szegediense]CAI8830366.1 type IV secretion system protein VirD4 [Methylocaldum szegediense]